MTTDLLDDLERAASLVESIGDVVVAKREVKAETDEGTAVEGHGCQHGGHNYIVLASEPWGFLDIRSGFNLDEVIAARSKMKKQPNIDNPNELDISSSEIQQARELLDEKLEDIDESKLRSVRLSLIKNLAKDDLVTQIDRSDGAKIHGFETSKRVYHNEDSFEVSDFYSAVQEVINTAWYGREYLGESYGLTDFIGRDQETSSPPDTPGFQ